MTKSQLLSAFFFSFDILSAAACSSWAASKCLAMNIFVVKTALILVLMISFLIIKFVKFKKGFIGHNL